MATTNKKNTTKKATAKKTVKKKSATSKTVKKSAVKKKVIKKKTTSKRPAKKIQPKAAANNNKIKVTPEQHHKMICEAAYYISLEKTFETVNPTEDWLQAESAINKIYTVNNK